jgi:hypothetical protein
LDECLDSIAAQTLAEHEVLAVDDHSRDGSGSLLRARARRDRRLRVLPNPGRGLVFALNHGLARARAGLVARMDADDRMHPERLALQRRYLRAHPGVDVLGSRVRGFPPHRLNGGLRQYLAWLNACQSPQVIADDIYLESPLAHPSVMFRVGVVRAAGGYRDGPFPEDYDLWLRLFQAGRVLAKLPQALLEWRDTPGRTSRRDPRCSRDAFDRLRARYLARDPRLCAAADRLAIWGAGRVTRRRAAHLLAEGYRPRVWIDIDPRKIGRHIEGIPVVGPEWLSRGERGLVLVYVAVHGARRQIADRLGELGYERGRDWLNVG